MLRLVGAVLATCALVGCGSAQIVAVEPVAGEAGPAFVVRSKAEGLATTDDRCWVEVLVSGWRGLGPARMSQGVAEPQPVESLVRTWERVHTDVPEGTMRVRFYYQIEVMDQKSFPTEAFDDALLIKLENDRWIDQRAEQVYADLVDARYDLGEEPDRKTAKKLRSVARVKAEEDLEDHLVRRHLLSPVGD